MDEAQILRRTHSVMMSLVLLADYAFTDEDGCVLHVERRQTPIPGVDALPVVVEEARRMRLEMLRRAQAQEMVEAEP